MIATDNTISETMLEALKRCKGLTLDSVLRTDTGNNVRMTSMQLVVLRFQGFDVELWNEEQPDIPGELTDLAKIRVHTNANQDVQSPIGKNDENGVFVPLDFIPTEIKRTIVGITIHNDRVKGFNAQGVKEFELDTTRTIVLSLGDRFLHIEKKCYWSEMWDISVRETERPEQSTEWENDGESSYEVCTYSLEL